MISPDSEVFTIYRCPECGTWEGSSRLVYVPPPCAGSRLSNHFRTEMLPLQVISLTAVVEALREQGIDADVQYPEAGE